MALKKALEGLPVERILRPGDRLLIEFGEGGFRRRRSGRSDLERVFGVAFYAVARVVPRGSADDLAALGHAAWDREIRGEKFRHSPCARQAQRQDLSARLCRDRCFCRTASGESIARRGPIGSEVKLNDPDLTCRIEIPPGPSLLVYARKIPGAGGLPPNTAGAHDVPAFGRPLISGRRRAQDDEGRRCI